MKKADTQAQHLFYDFPPWSFLAILLMIFVWVMPRQVHAAEVTLAWDPNEESDVQGYVVYYGTDSMTYSDSIDVETATRHTLLGLVEGETYYIAVTAYTTSCESDFSDEVDYQVSADLQSGINLSKSKILFGIVDPIRP